MLSVLKIKTKDGQSFTTNQTVSNGNEMEFISRETEKVINLPLSEIRTMEVEEVAGE